MDTLKAKAGRNNPQVVITEEPLYEVVGGQCVETPFLDAFEGNLRSILTHVLGPFARTHGLGRVESEMLFFVDKAKDLQRRPDLAFVSFRRWPRNRRVPKTSAWDVVPELGVEIVSPTNSGTEIIGKICEYFQAGMQRVWVIYPVEELVYVYSSPTQVRILTRNDELDDETLLPDFRLPLRDLFEEETPEATPPS